MTGKIPVTVAKGDGIGPEIMDAVLKILDAAGAPLDIHDVEIGEKVYLKGFTAGIEPKTWDTIRNTKAFLKAPITTPQGGGFKSLNVSIRGFFGLFANVRPCVSYHPFIQTKHPNMDVVVIRENEEDLYTGIEYQQTQDSVHALKMITRTGSEKIVRFAFEFAKKHGRKKVTCFTKDNILKLSDGLFHKVFEEIAKEYPDIENEHWIIDIGSAKMADTPENFDVIVLPNLYGDILSDVAAQIAGSVGLAGSANIGREVAMFEAIHGSAPRRAGQNLANPSGLLHGAIMMLVHLGLPKVATDVHNGWLKTIEDGIHTYDVFKEGISKEKVGTKEFAEAVCQRLGQKPTQLKPVVYEETSEKGYSFSEVKKHAKQDKGLVGVDVFIDSEQPMKSIQDDLAKLAKGTHLELAMIANRGICLWPNEGMPEADVLDNWRLRFLFENGTKGTYASVLDLMKNISELGLDVTKTENLYTFDGNKSYSLSQKEQ